MNTELSPIIPEPRCGLSIRPATAADMPFMDRLQKAHTHMAGFFPRQQMQKYLEAGAVIIAEDERGNPLGYCIARDTYSGRDDVGIIYQLIVEPLRQRHLVGASLVKAAFERAAYGCRLFCCWCAQDIAANFFWESMGFAPVAFRTGTRSKQRTHIFWQCRTRAGDTQTPWWYPHQTRSGAFREDRLVFPIPAGVHWRDPMPVIMPEAPAPLSDRATGSLPASAPAIAPDTGVQAASATATERPTISQARKVAIVRSASKALQGLPPGKAAVITGGGIRYIDRADYVPEPEPEAAPAKKPRKPRAPTPKHDPQHIALARELRDRWLEEVAHDPSLLLPAGKYDPARQLPEPAPRAAGLIEARVLPAAA